MAVSSNNNNYASNNNSGGTTANNNNTAANNAGRGQIPIVCPGHTRPLAELQFCHVKEENRTFLVSACHDRMPMLRDGVTGDWIGTWSGHKGAVWSCRVDPTGSLAATASGDFTCQVWDAITGNLLYTFPHQHIVKTCDFSPNAKWLATGGYEGIVRIYNLLQTKDRPTEILISRTAAAAADKIYISKVVWLSNTCLLAGCSDGKIRAWKLDPQTHAPVNKDAAPEYILEAKPTNSNNSNTAPEVIRDLELVRAGTIPTGPLAGKDILTAAAGSSVYFFHVTESGGSLLKCHTLNIHFREEGGASLHPTTGTKFIAGGSDLWVHVLDYETGTELECCKGHHGPIRCLRYSPDGKLYASGSEDGTIRLWKTNPDEDNHPTESAAAGAADS